MSRRKRLLRRGRGGPTEARRALHALYHLIERQHAVDHVRRQRRIGTEHTALAHARAHLVDRHTAPARHVTSERAVVVVHPALHEPLGIRVEWPIGVAFGLVLARADERDIYSGALQRGAHVLVRHPHAD